MFFVPSNEISKLPLRFAKHFSNRLCDKFPDITSSSIVEQKSFPCSTRYWSPAICHNSVAIPLSFRHEVMHLAWSEYDVSVGSPSTPDQIHTMIREPTGQDNKSSKTYRESSWRSVVSREKVIGATSRSISRRRLARELIVAADFFRVARVALKLNNSYFW